MEFCAVQHMVWDWDHCRALHSRNAALGSLLPAPTGGSHRANRNVQEHHRPAGMGAAAGRLLGDQGLFQAWEMAWRWLWHGMRAWAWRGKAVTNGSAGQQHGCHCPRASATYRHHTSVCHMTEGHQEWTLLCVPVPEGSLSQARSARAEVHPHIQCHCGVGTDVAARIHLPSMAAISTG